MTDRDLFAAAAMSGMISAGMHKDFATIRSEAYRMADLMISGRPAVPGKGDQKGDEFDGLAAALRVLMNLGRQRRGD